MTCDNLINVKCITWRKITSCAKFCLCLYLTLTYHLPIGIIVISTIGIILLGVIHFQKLVSYLLCIQIANFTSYITHLATIITNVLACHKLYIVGLILDKEHGCSFVIE